VGLRFALRILVPEESQLGAFSIPIGLGFVASTGRCEYARRALEPSAGSGLLAVDAELAGGSLVLTRSGGQDCGDRMSWPLGHAPFRILICAPFGRKVTENIVVIREGQNHHT
jgi:hypothetical protein